MAQEVTDVMLNAAFEATEASHGLSNAEISTIYLAMREHDAPADVDAIRATGIALLEAAERHIFADECLKERSAFRAALGHPRHAS